MKLLDERRGEFEQGSAFLYLCLGLLAGAERLDALLARRASGDPPDDDHPLIFFLLGVVSFERRLAQHLHAAAENGAAQPGNDARPPPPHGRAGSGSLLR